MGEKKLTFREWWRKQWESGHQFGRAFFGWLRWCKHGFPRRQGCMQCGMVEWTYGPRGQILCSDAICKSELEDQIDF